MVEEKGEIVITALPYQVSGTKVLEQIASQMQSKKLPMVQDLVMSPIRASDSTRHRARSNRVDSEQLMNHLFATTDLERSYRVNHNVITLSGRPGVCSLRDLLSEWRIS